MMFGCEITCTEGCHAFFTDNLFYSTATSRIARRLLPGCVTTQDVGRALRERGAIPATAADAEAAGEGLR